MLRGAIVRVLEPNRVMRGELGFVLAFAGDRLGEYDSSYIPPEGAMGILLYERSGLENKCIVALEDHHTIVISARYLQEVIENARLYEPVPGNTQAERMDNIAQEVQRLNRQYNRSRGAEYGSLYQAAAQASPLMQRFVQAYRNIHATVSDYGTEAFTQNEDAE